MQDLIDTPVAARTPAEEKIRHEGNKLSKRLARETTRAIADHNMIEAGDRVMVCLSGGKDSYALLDILLSLRKRAPFSFDIVAVNLDQKQPGFPPAVLDRQSVVSGQSVSVRVDVGGARII